MLLALAQINPTIGDIAGNAAIIARQSEQARDAGADLIVFPELALCGYPPKDLLLEAGFIDRCERAANELGREHSRGITLVIGLPMHARRQPGITNSLLAFRDGALLDRHDKRLLPTYDVFDENRYFVPGNEAVVIAVPDGKNGITRVGLSICEDLWKGEDVGFSARYTDAPDPVAGLAAAGAQLIINASAAPFVLHKHERHRALLARHAKQRGVHVAAVNQVGGNDELVFDGRAVVLDDRGEVLRAAPGFCEHLLLAEVPGGRDGDAIDPDDDSSGESSLFQALVLGVRDYLRKCGNIPGGIIGLSGGIDSALTAAIAVAALGRERVLGVSMPGPFSSEGSITDAKILAANLGITCIDAPIDGAFAAFRGGLDKVFHGLGLPILGERMPDLTQENLQSRLRGTLLMALSNRTGRLVLTTGNKSELAVGYCTLYGDMNGGLAVISDLTKGAVYSLSRWINTHHDTLHTLPVGFADGRSWDRPPIPESTITKPPSAELAPGQKDQDSLPPYDVLDEIVRRYVELRESPEAIRTSVGADAPTVARIIRLINAAEFKRAQAATGIKVTGVAFGSGRRIPIAHGWRP